MMMSKVKFTPYQCPEESRRFCYISKQSKDNLFGTYENKSNCHDSYERSKCYNTNSWYSLKECQFALTHIENDIIKLQKQKEITEIAIIHCLEDCVSSNLTASYVSDVFKEYMKEGFKSKKFQIFFKDVKNAFLSVPDKNGSLDYLNGIQCIYFDGGNYDNYIRTLDHYNCCMSHCKLIFKTKDKGDFSLHIPIADNTHFTFNNMNDDFTGRYFVEHALYKTDDSVSFKACDTAKFIMEMLTTDKYVFTRDELKNLVYEPKFMIDEF